MVAQMRTDRPFSIFSAFPLKSTKEIHPQMNSERAIDPGKSERGFDNGANNHPHVAGAERIDQVDAGGSSGRGGQNVAWK